MQVLILENVENLNQYFHAVSNLHGEAGVNSASTSEVQTWSDMQQQISPREKLGAV